MNKNTDVFIILRYDSHAGTRLPASAHWTMGEAVEERTRLVEQARRCAAGASSEVHETGLYGEKWETYTIHRTSMHERNGRKKRGRKKTTGRFETREQLEERIWLLYDNADLSDAGIAQSCRVSPGVVASVLKQGRNKV